ncbi:MAG: tetratricopeptide repeat protein [Flavipsychrobacter sp.]|jgi:tetratricopeptide (TPR) repeat protein|nr:tetratricopeptide repeat protein [Flavipsychrobacter sp.]
MRLKHLSIYLALFLSTGIVSSVHAQEETTDTLNEMSRAGKNAIADKFYFDAMKARSHNDDKLAAELLQKYVDARPEVSYGWYELSKINHAERRMDKADEYIKKAISLDPGNKWYKEQQAALLADKGKFLEAANIVVELSKAEPREVNYLVVAAEYFAKAKKYDEAVSYFDKALVQHVGDEEIQMRKMQLYLEMNNVEKAATVVQEMIAKDPRNAKYYKLLADIYESNKQPGKAADVYGQAAKVIPDDPLIKFGIAEGYLRTGDTLAYRKHIMNVILDKGLEPEDQLGVFQTFLQKFPNDSIMSREGSPIIRQLAEQYPDDDLVMAFWGDMLQLNGQHDSAMMMYSRSLRIKPNNPNLWGKLLVGYGDKKYADSLIKTSERAMRLFPNMALYSYFNGIGYMNKKQYPQAINAVKRAIDLQPENDNRMLADMHALLADIYHSNKQDDLSDKSFEKALSYDPGNAGVLNNYAYYLSERGKKLDEAERMSQKSLDQKPNEGTYLDTYGWIQYKKGNYLKAKDYIERAIKLAGDNVDATLYDHLGNICYQLNEKDKALEYWKKAKAIGGGDDAMLDKKISEGKLYE